MKELDVGYLHRHFLILMSTVQDLYDDLLLPEESKFLNQYSALSYDAQNLLLRLLSRKFNWLQIASLNYAEVSDVFGAIKELAEQSLVVFPENLNFLDAVSLTSRSTAEAILQQQNVSLSGTKSFSKQSFINWAAMAADSNQQAGFVSIVSNEWVRPALFAKDMYQLLQYLYFGNSAQTLTDFVLNELELATYEKYTLHKATRFFDDRATIEDCRTANLLSSLCYEYLIDVKCVLSDQCLLEIQHQAQNLLASSREKSHIKLYKLLSVLGRTWERRKQWNTALICYADNVYAEDRIRFCLTKLDRKEEALKLAEANARKNTFLDKQAIAPSEMRFGFQERTKSIEDLALDHWASLGWTGWHCENTLWTSLFGLVFWEAIFDDVPGAFFHPFQAGPIGSFSRTFYAKRSGLCDQILCDFRLGHFNEDALLKRWHSKKGIMNYWVSWSENTLLALQSLISVVPPKELAQILFTMVSDPKNATSGFPDLFIIKGTEFALWEVKGPGDRIRPTQQSWLNLFCSLDWKAGICYLYLT